MWTSVRVDRKVHVELRHARESLPAFAAHVRTHAGVRALVDREISPEEERLVALVTLEGSLGEVRLSVVGIEHASRDESAVALHAFERSFPAVNSLVVFEVAKFVVRLAAFAALISMSGRI